jgi:predicted small lipoprotein YifL
VHRWLPILIALTLPACGQRGPLYLPAESNPAGEAVVGADAPGSTAEGGADDEVLDEVPDEDLDEDPDDDPDDDGEQDDAPEP